MLISSNNSDYEVYRYFLRNSGAILYTLKPQAAVRLKLEAALDETSPQFVRPRVRKHGGFRSTLLLGFRV